MIHVPWMSGKGAMPITATHQGRGQKRLEAGSANCSNAHAGFELGARASEAWCGTAAIHATAARLQVGRGIAARRVMRIIRQSSATGHRARVARVSAECPNQLDYSGMREKKRNTNASFFES